VQVIGWFLPHLLENGCADRLPVRISHWLNVPFFIILIMSGLQIFNAHPALYWGDRSDRDRPLFSIRPWQTDSGDIKGVTTILGHSFNTTGVFGYSNESGRAFYEPLRQTSSALHLFERSRGNHGIGVLLVDRLHGPPALKMVVFARHHSSKRRYTVAR